MRYVLGIIVLIVLGSLNFQKKDPHPLLMKNPDERKLQKIWVDSVYNSLTLQQKIGQLFVPMVFSENDQEFDTTLRLIRENHIGGVIFSRGTPHKQSLWLNEFQANSNVPLLVSMDAEWGVGMRLDSVIDFPWAMTLGAIQDLSLIEQIGFRMGQQAQRLGIHMSHGPVLDINTDPDNPIIGNRSFGESKERVTKIALAYMKGHHKAGVLTTGKHFPGHGDTDADSHLTLPTISLNQDRIKEIELYPYRNLFKHGLSSVMVAHLNVPSLTDSVLPTSLSKRVVTGILKEKMKFKGLILTDALNMKGATMMAPSTGIDKEAFLAGNDVLLISNDIPSGIQEITLAVESGEITTKRLKHSVKKILNAKYKVGLYNYSPVNVDRLHEDLNPSQDQELYNQAISDALTLVKNQSELIPIKEFTHLGYLEIGDVSGEAFENEISKYLKLEKINAQDIKEIDSLSVEFDTVLVSYHKGNQSPYVNYRFNENELFLIDKLSKKFKVILVSFTSPYALGQLLSPKKIESILVAYQNSPSAQEIAAQALVGLHSIKGRLPISPSSSIELGSGIDIPISKAMPIVDPQHLGFDSDKLNRLDELAQVAIDSMIAPGLQMVVARKGKIVYQKSFGYHTYSKQIKVENDHIYDLASLTKILATVPLVMQEIDNNELSLDEKLENFHLRAKGTNKSGLTIKQLLSHHAGLKSWIPFYLKTLNSLNKPMDDLYSQKYSEDYPIQVFDNLFLHKDYTQEILEEIYTSQVQSKPRYRYSDLGFILLMDYFQTRYAKPFDELISRRLLKPLGLENITYNPYLTFENEKIVPSEHDQYFRYGHIDGYVHDMASALMGGLGAHAGLFANAKDVAVIMQLFLQKGQYMGKEYFDSDTFDLFNKRYFQVQGNDRVLGFDKRRKINPTRLNVAKDASDESFGHFGFTGTFAWADPENELIFVFLSNRTYPTMENKLISQQYIRPRMHQLVYEALIDEKVN